VENRIEDPTMAFEHEVLSPKGVADHMNIRIAVEKVAEYELLHVDSPRQSRDFYRARRQDATAD
jgi:hypothetical protein